MARTFQLSDLRTRVRERADMENSEFISDAELNRYISASYTELYDLLIKADPERYLREQTLAGDGSTTDFATASDYYGTIYLKYRKSSTDMWRPLERLMGREAMLLDDNTADEPMGWHPVYNTSTPTTQMLRVLPPIKSGETVTHAYTVSPADLTSDTDIIDGVAGWEEYVVIDAAIKCLTKEESSTAVLERQLERMRRRLEEMAENRSIEQSGHVVDSHGANSAFAYTDFLDSANWRWNKP